MQPKVPKSDAKAMHSAQGGAGNRRLLLTLITLLAVAGTVALGVWQLQRAAAKEALASQIDAKSKLPTIENTTLLAMQLESLAGGSVADKQPNANLQALINRQVRLRGTWLHQHGVFLDNRFMAGRSGFFVITPLQLEDSTSVIWVQRGWVPRDPLDRTKLPELPAPAGSATVQGRLVAEVSRIYALGSSAALPSLGASSPGAARASRIWQNLPTINFGQSTPLLSLAVLQTAATEQAEAQDGLQRDWLVQDTGVAKHYGYAFQWFALCGLIIVLYVWFQFIAPRRRTS